MRDARAHYAGLVKQIDHEVGELIDTLRRNDLLESTVIVFSTDHGDHLGDHGIEGKATFYEASAHIPLLVRAPGKEEGSTCSDLVELRDVTATMLALAGCDLPGYMDSRPLPGLGLNGPPPRSHIFGMLSGAWMAFDGRYKLSKYSSGEAMLFRPRQRQARAREPDCQLRLHRDLPKPRHRADRRVDALHVLRHARPDAPVLLGVRGRSHGPRRLDLALPCLRRSHRSPEILPLSAKRVAISGYGVTGSGSTSSFGKISRDKRPRR